MLARRSSRVLHALIKSAALPTDAAASAQLVVVNTQGLPSSFVAAWRSFGTSFWDVPTSARQDLYIEMMSIRSMLPNRSPFTPHFTPHGVMLMPHSSSMQLMQQQHQSVAADEEAGAEEAAAEVEQGMWADSVKRKRKLKMKKHKLKKRRKLTRHQP
jgi:hypothetical protein